VIAQTLFRPEGESDFRWRGAAVSRIEALSDAVFALALTLIVVTLEAPRTWAQLSETFVQAPVFAACFAFLAWCWLTHFRFHRRFGFEDLPTTWLNLALLFLILLYVYPLRFLAGFLYEALVLQRGWTIQDASGRNLPLFESREQVRWLMWIYGAGFAAIFGVFAALYACAWRARAQLQLDSVERVITKSALHSHLLSASVGLVSIAISVLDEEWVAFSGMFYGILGPLHFVHGLSVRRAIERFRNKIPDAPRESP
jgi:hypothetical protein